MTTAWLSAPRLHDLRVANEGARLVGSFGAAERVMYTALVQHQAPHRIATWLAYAGFAPLGLHRVYLSDWPGAMRLWAVLVVTVALYPLTPLAPIALAALWVIEGATLSRRIRERRATVEAGAQVTVIAARREYAGWPGPNRDR